MKFLFGIVLVFVAAGSLAQTDSSFTLISTYNGDVTGVALDNLDNLYIITSTGQVKKINSKGDSAAVFNGIRNFGKLHSIDITNPLKPLLFYKDFSSVVILDRLLANRSSLDLRRFNILQPTAIGLSYDNNILVFDQFDYKLKKIDESGNLLLETSDFRQLFNEAITPHRIINDNGLIYLADSTKGIWVFDNYGAYKRKIPAAGWRIIDVWQDNIIRLSKNGIVVYDPVRFIERTKKFPSTFIPYHHSFTYHNRFVTFSPDTVKVYQFSF